MKNILITSSLLTSFFVAKNETLTNGVNKQLDCNVLQYAKKAICILNPDGNSSTRGIVEIGQIQVGRPVHILGKFTGLDKNSKHGFHIHQWGNLTQGCVTAGPHFNPFNKSHGGPNDDERHIGDLGNIESDIDGNATYELIDNKISLFGVNSIIGRSLVVHKNEDDLGRGGFEDSLTTGHSGARVACGVIGLTQFTEDDMHKYLY